MDYDEKEANLIKSLATLLRQNGDNILNGDSKLSLTTRCLSILNEGFTSLSDEGDFVTSFEVPPPNSPRFPVMQDLQFLYDFVQKTYALKILHSTSTVSGRINLTSFRALQTLEIKKIPLHLLCGVNKLRARLKVVICTRCLTCLMELLELCGGDMAAALSWPQVHTFSAAFNGIKELDNSLRLLPSVNSLDLSHNAIEETENYLQHLTELQTLNLSFNKLTSVPTFSISGRKTLSSISLRSNNLSSLKGLEELVNLRDVDLGDNCLASHQCLIVFKGMLLLRTVYLVGNPIYYHKKHRQLSLEAVPNSVLSKLMLDGKPVTKKEISLLSKNKKTYHIPNGTHAHIPAVDDLRPLLSETRSSASISSVGDTGSVIDDTDFASGLRAKAKNRRKGKKIARKVDVVDVDVEDGDSSPDLSQTSTPTQTSEHLSFKEHIENVRQHLGHDWLQTMNLSRQVTAKVIAGKVINASEDDLYLKNSEVTSVVHSVGQQKQQVFVEVIAQKDGEASQDSDIDITDAVERERKNSLPKNVRRTNSNDMTVRRNSAGSWNNERTITPELVAERSTKQAKDPKDQKLRVKSSNTYGTPTEESYDSTNPFAEDLQSDSYYTPDTSMTKKREPDGYLSDNMFASDIRTEKSDSVLLSSDAYDETNPFTEDLRDERTYTRQSSGQESDFSWGLNKSDNAVDLGPESDPFIVTLPEDDDNEFIIVLTDTYLVEKDLNGGVIETLDLRMIQTVSALSQHSGNDENATPVLKLTFDYVRKDRRERRYVMEDSQNAKAFMELMNPILQAAQEAKALKNKLHCLKCGSDFSKDSAHRRLPKNAVRSGTYTNLAGAVETGTGHLEEELYCPFCNSTMLIEQEPCHSEKKTASYTSIPRNFLPSTGDVSGSIKSTSTYSSAIGTPIMALKDLDIYASAKPSSVSEVSFQLGGEILPKLPAHVKASSDINENTLKSANAGHDEQVYDESARPIKRVGSLDNKSIGRKDSVDSDITVLSRQTSAVSYTDSDIAVITASGRNSLDSREVTPVKVIGQGDLVSDSNNQSKTSRDDTPTSNPHSPYGSLNNKTLNSMIETIYEKSINDKTLQNLKRNNSNASLASMTSTGTHSSVEHHPVAVLGTDGSYSMREKGRIEYWYDDFSRIDHRLKLHLTMSVFSEMEDFQLLLRCGIVPFTSGTEFPGLLVISSKNVFVFKIKSNTRDDQPETWLKQLACQSLSNLCYVDIGLGYQSFRVEFGSESNCFTFIVRDDTWCKKFISQFTEILQDTAFSSHGKLEGITKNNPKTVASLEKQVLSASTLEDDDSMVSEIDSTLLKYCLAYQHTGEKNSLGQDALCPVSLAVTPSHICLATEDHRFPVPRCRTSDFEGQQFHLKDKQRITDITQLDLYCQDRRTLTIHFFDEGTSEECQWKITMETDQCLQSMVDAIKEPWENQFGVPLQLNSEIL